MSDTVPFFDLHPHEDAAAIDGARAAFYRAALPSSIDTIAQRDAGHVYHLFPIRSPRRDALQQHLRAAGIDTLIHYPAALSRQAAFARYDPRACPTAARAAATLLSLPLYPALADATVERVAAAVATFEKGRRG